MSKYVIEVSEDQLSALIAATEMLARVGIGQFVHLEHYSPATVEMNQSVEKYQIFINALRTVELTAKSGLSMSNGDVKLICQRSWDMYQVFRNRLSWDLAGNPVKRDWSKMHGVNYDDPMTVTGENFAKIKLS